MLCPTYSKDSLCAPASNQTHTLTKTVLLKMKFYHPPQDRSLQSTGVALPPPRYHRITDPQLIVLTTATVGTLPDFKTLVYLVATHTTANANIWPFGLARANFPGLYLKLGILTIYGDLTVEMPLTEYHGYFFLRGLLHRSCLHLFLSLLPGCGHGQIYLHISLTAPTKTKQNKLSVFFHSR